MSRWLVLGGFFSILCSIHGFGKTFKVNDAGKRDTVRFVLDAPLEVINGTTNSISGHLEIDDNNKVSGSFEVPVSSIKTGIESRDEHLQNDKWLNAKAYPKLLMSLEPFEIESGFFKGTQVTKSVNAKFSIHGKTQEERINLELSYLPQSAQTRLRLDGNLVRIKAAVELKLSDYGIAQSDSKAKELLGLKVGETASVSVDLMGSDAK